MKLTAMLGGLVAVGLAVGWGLTRGGDGGEAGAPSEGMLFTVPRGDLLVTLTENGTLVAKESRKISSGTDSQGKVTFLIEEGKAVPEGELLCKLDSTELETQVEQLGLDIVQAQANLDTARTELDIQKTENAAAIEKGQLALEKAHKEQDRYRDGDAPAERRKLDVAIKEAETGHSRAKKKYEDSQKLFEQTYINKSQLEQDQIDYERAVVQLDGSHLDLQMFEKYTLPMGMRDREVAVRDAEREKENAEKRAQSTLRQKEVGVEQNEKRLQMLNKQLEKTQKEIAKMTITAPIPGIVLYGDPDEPWYRENIRLGGEVWGGMTLFTLPDLRVMQVKLQIHEADINKLKEGQTAKVSMDTYPGVMLDGDVTRIASIAGGGDDRWNRDPEVRKFSVEITLKGGDELRLKPGISAKAEIYIDKREQAVYVPLQCVFTEEGRSFCWVDDGGEPQRAEVTPGMSNDNFVEILAGLDPGKRVLLYNPKLDASRTGGAAAEDKDAEKHADKADDKLDEKAGEKAGTDAAAQPANGATPKDADTGSVEPAATVTLTAPAAPATAP